jgi:hypothetical protein
MEPQPDSDQGGGLGRCPSPPIHGPVTPLQPGRSQGRVCLVFWPQSCISTTAAPPPSCSSPRTSGSTAAGPTGSRTPIPATAIPRRSAAPHCSRTGFAMTRKLQQFHRWSHQADAMSRLEASMRAAKALVFLSVTQPIAWSIRRPRQATRTRASASSTTTHLLIGDFGPQSRPHIATISTRTSVPVAAAGIFVGALPGRLDP